MARIFLRTQNVEKVVAWDGDSALYTKIFKTCGLYYDQRGFFQYEEKRKVNILGVEIELPQRFPMGRLVYRLDENGEEVVENAEGRRVYYECPNEKKSHSNNADNSVNVNMYLDSDETASL